MKWQERQKEWEIVVSLQKARIANLEGVLRNLVDKLDAIDKVVTGVFVMAAIHGCEYSGPNYGEELKAARKVLDHE